MLVLQYFQIHEPSEWAVLQFYQIQGSSKMVGSSKVGGLEIKWTVYCRIEPEIGWFLRFNLLE